MLNHLIEFGLDKVNKKEFSKLIDFHQYGNGKHKLFIGFIKRDSKNVIAFYPSTSNKVSMLNECYSLLESALRNEDTDTDIQFGDCGIPIKYGDLRRN
jgi:serine/threonine-protein kinase RIO1